MNTILCIIYMLITLFYIIKYIRSFSYPSIPNLNNNELINICGITGCGKTYFSKLILEKYPNSIYINLDRLFFIDSIKDTNIFINKLKFLINKNNKKKIIILDGNYSLIRKNIWKNCDKIYYLDIPSIYRIKNIIKREYNYSKKNEKNDYGNYSNFCQLICHTLIKSKKSLIWHASGLDFYKKNLKNGIISYNNKFNLNQNNSNNKPYNITYLKGYFELKEKIIESFLLMIFTFYLLYIIFFYNFE